MSLLKSPGKAGSASANSEDPVLQLCVELHQAFLVFQGLGFGVQSSGFRVYRFQGLGAHQAFLAYESLIL